jgi:hypothetical protein
LDTIIKLSEIIKSKPTLIIGSGVHKAFGQGPSGLNDWTILLEDVCNELKLPLRKDQLKLLSYKFEDFITDYCDLYKVASHIAEVKLKQTIAKRLMDLAEAQDNEQYLVLLDKLSPKQVLSLNVDSLFISNTKNLTTSKTIGDIPFETKADCNGLPVYFLNGNVKKPNHMNFGMRSLANQIVAYENQFKRFKQLERENDFNVDEIINQDGTWFSRFMHFPVLIVGASVGEHELALRYLLNQRKRNFANHPEYKSPVNIVLDRKAVSNAKYMDELKTMDIEPLVFGDFDEFWEGVNK